MLPKEQATPIDALQRMEWGTRPELVGPRHHYRVRLMARTLAAWLPPVGAPRVLDAGAGRGTLTGLLLERGYRVAALDEAEGFLRYLSDGVPAEVTARLTPVRGDVARLPFADGAFAGVVCGEVLEHVADDAAVAAELARVLQPGGILVLTVPLGRERFSWLDRWAGHIRRYERFDLAALLSGAGFKVRALRYLGFPFGALYERLVQRPVLGREARHGTVPMAVRVGGSGAARWAGELVFRLDEACAWVPRGTGMLAVARRRREAGHGAVEALR